MKNDFTKKIILEDGSEYLGYGFGADSEKFAEIVFNTSMAGYQEILSDPSYTYQAVVMTYPLIGNYGMNNDDYETEVPTISAMIVREYNDFPSNFRSCKTLSAVMKKFDIAGVYGIDTRALTRKIRNYGSCKALICDASVSLEEGLKRLEAWVPETDGVAKVSTKEIWRSPTSNPKYNVVAIDCGIKLNIVRSLNKAGCNVTVVPWDTTAEEIESYKPDGIFISNGPGNPEDAVPTIAAIKALKGKYPIFGICLGHQIISLAHGAKTYKLKFGHRGGNHPVKNLKTDKVEITSQNHSYAVDDKSLAGTGLEATHINLLDNTIEGVENKEACIFSVQYHPESAPGPQDSGYLFHDFVELMKEYKAKEGK